MPKLPANFKGAIKWVLPQHVVNRIKHRRRQMQLARSLASDFRYDYRRYLKLSAVRGQFETQPKLRAKITIGYHKIEKGLSLREPRRGFGAEVVDKLLADLAVYTTRYGFDKTVQIALDVLVTYTDFNLTAGIENQALQGKILKLQENRPASQDGGACLGGVVKVTRRELLAASNHDLAPFFETRHSIRHFSPEDVDITLIERAVRMAQHTPSVCNRQAWKVYAFSGADEKRRVLELQNGNRGFGDQASVVLVITTQLDHFVHLGERNQCWVDGGMFAMSVVYALHSLGLASCCLNWSVRPHVDQKLKRVTGIPDAEAVIMLIAVGHLPDELMVAQSTRKQLHEVLTVK